MPSAIRAAPTGAGLGILVAASGYTWNAIGEHTPLDLGRLVVLATIGGLGGAVTAFVLYFTKDFRARGIIQLYCSWMLACFIASLVVLLPDLRTYGWREVGVALWLGCSAGLGFAVIERRVKASSTDVNNRP